MDKYVVRIKSYVKNSVLEKLCGYFCICVVLRTQTTKYNMDTVTRKICCYCIKLPYSIVR